LEALIGIEERQVKTTARAFAVLVFCFCCLSKPAGAQANVVTFHNDIYRTGANQQETILTPSNVNVNQFGKLFTQPVDGYIVGAALYLANVTIPGVGTHNVVYVATMNDSIYAFDADSNQGANAAPLWKVNFTNPAAGVTVVPVEDLSCVPTTQFRQMGIEGTSVIDPATGTLYVVVKTLENGVYTNRIHALDVTTGLDKVPNQVVSGSVIGANGVTVPFVDFKQMVRPSLLLANGVLYISFGSLGCNGGGVYGWVMAYNAVLGQPNTLQQLGIFCTTPNVDGGAGFWLGGGGPAADDEGNIYEQTADGFFDENTNGGDYGDTLLKLSLQPNGLILGDYFTPFDQATLKAKDQDLGSAGVLVLPDQTGLFPHVMIAGGKEGNLYLINRDNLGQYCNGCTSDAQILQTIPAFGSIRATPAFWNNTIYAAGGNGVTAFSLTNGQLTALSSTVKMGSLTSPIISSNGLTNGVLWIMNGNILFAFDPTNLTKQLYSSKLAGARDVISPTAHFAPVVEAGGKVFVGTTVELTVFGLFPGLAPASGNNQSGTVLSTLPAPIQVQGFNPYTDTVYSGVTVTFSDGGKGGTFSNPTAVTDSNGFASTTYTFPKRALGYTITASSPGIGSAVFTETALPGAASKLGATSGVKQTGEVLMPLPAPIVVSVLDPYGNPVPNFSVNFSDGGAGGSFSANPAITSAQGKATVTYMAGPNPGSITITASATGLAGLKIPETITP
jgi:Bacterial Ig-like domain (group 1)